MKNFFLLILFILLNLNSLSFANENEIFIDNFFKELDFNKDGTIDKKDLEKFSKYEFKLMNPDNSGRVSKKDFLEFVCNKSCNSGSCECKNYTNKEELPYLKEYWEKIDANKDGILTISEKFDEDMSNFYSLDVNSDGKITKIEVESTLY